MQQSSLFHYNSGDSFFFKGANTAYAYIAELALLYDPTSDHGSAGSSYGKICGENDIVSMKLDMNDLTLSYKINNIDQGIAFKIEKTKYKAAIYLYGNSIIELMKSRYIY